MARHEELGVSADAHAFLVQPGHVNKIKVPSMCLYRSVVVRPDSVSQQILVLQGKGTRQQPRRRNSCHVPDLLEKCPELEEDGHDTDRARDGRLLGHDGIAAHGKEVAAHTTSRHVPHLVQAVLYRASKCIHHQGATG